MLEVRLRLAPTSLAGIHRDRGPGTPLKSSSTLPRG